MYNVTYSNQWAIGHRNWNGGATSDYLGGYIDEVLIMKEVLGDSDIALAANEGIDGTQEAPASDRALGMVITIAKLNKKWGTNDKRNFGYIFIADSLLN